MLSRTNTNRGSITPWTSEVQPPLQLQAVEDLYMDLELLKKLLASLFPDVKCRVSVRPGRFLLYVPRFLTDVSP